MLFFAAKIVLVFVTVIGAEFQSLVASPIKVLGVLLVLNFSNVVHLRLYMLYYKYKVETLPLVC